MDHLHGPGAQLPMAQAVTVRGDRMYKGLTSSEADSGLAWRAIENALLLPVPIPRLTAGQRMDAFHNAGHGLQYQ